MRTGVLAKRSERVIEAIRRGEPVSDEDLKRALGLRHFARLPLWERALIDREKRTASRARLKVRPLA